MAEKSKKITVAKGIKVARGKEEKMREGKGSGSAGKYKNVSPKDFAGASGGASKYSFPIPDLAHARNALARAHFAPDPEGIKARVYKMYPELKKRHEEREEGHKPSKLKEKSKKSHLKMRCK
ncbi:MAG TPA: hypothetical protein VHA52_02380 [Candidatus Babeliaceae bacterium]|nr:hypothetical protein [Candidatus Babeliaceae bacterium]